MSARVKKRGRPGRKSGRFVQRVPKALHAKLARLAEREEVSLNTLVTDILAAAVAARLKPGSRSPRKSSVEVAPGTS
jgi:antitoxin HicB